jgi:hypothetical protein
MTSEKRLTAVERQRAALELRKAGKSYEAIAQELGYGGPSSAHNAVKAALRKTLQEPADDLRALEVARMDAMLDGLWPKVLDGNPRAVEVAIKVLERRARLLGLDAPQKINIEQVIAETADRFGLTPDERVELQASVATFLAAQRAGV